jgi:hypothetical protein
VTCFDVLHDFGDPLGAARHIREQLAADGTWMIVEPAAGASVVDNLNPIGRLYYGFSTFLCVPNALSEEGGYSLGAQAGEEPIGRLASAGWLQPVPSGTRRPGSTPCTRPDREREPEHTTPHYGLQEISIPASRTPVQSGEQ